MDLFETSLAPGHAAAEKAADRAGEEWKAKAYTAFLAYSLGHRQFTTEDVRLANPNLAEPPDRRAWGAIALKAARRKIVRKIGWTEAKSPEVHGNAVTLWETIG